MTEQDPFLRLMREAWNEGNVVMIDEVTAADCVAHYGRQAMPDDSLAERIQTWRRAFPDLHFDIEDHIVAGDRTVTRWHGEGTHRGPFSGIAPTNRRISYDGITICRIANGKIHEVWVASNSSEMLAALRAERSDQ